MAEEKRNSGGAPERASSSQRRRRRRRSSGAKAASAVLYVLIVIGVSAVLATVGWTWANDLLALNKEYSSTVIELPESIFQYQEVTDENGDTTTVSTADMDYVADELKEAGLIEYKFLFKIFCWVSNADEKVTAGSYELDTDMDYRGLVANMSDSSSTRQTVDVTIPEGYTVDQILALLEEQGVSTVEKLQEMAADWPYKWEWLPDIPLGDYHRLEGYLFKDTVKNQVYVTKKPQPGAKTAVTEYRTLCSAMGLSLVECRLLTGRTHQIRAQMAAAGCPLLGDGKYGRERINRTYGETGQMLYSYKLTFTLPTDAGRLEYLRGRTFQVQRVPFAEKYFPDFKLS